MAYSQNFPAQRPSFMFDASNAGRIPPNMTFSRASTGSYFGTEKVLSSENLLLQSQDFDTTWSASGIGSPTGSQSAPDGTSTAWLITADTGSVGPRVQQTVSLTTGSSYTLVAHVKSGTATHAYVCLRGDSANDYAYGILEFASPSSVTTGGVGFTAISGSVTALGSSWYRISVTSTAASVSSPIAFVGITDGTAPSSNGVATYTAAGETLYIWGAQLSTTGTKVYDSPTTTQIARSYQTKLQTAASGAARFEHSATDGQSAGTSLGILVEGQSTNLATYSQDFSNAAWVKARLTATTAAAIAPDGTLTANQLTADGTAANTHSFYFDYTTGGATAQTVSFYVKAGTLSWIQIRFSNTNGAFSDSWANYNLSTGAIGTISGGVTASASSCGNGWYRIVATQTALTNATGRIVVYTQQADNTRGYDGNSYDYLLIWGGQIEANSSHASSLVGTSGATATRASDSLSVATADIGYTGGPMTLVTDTTVSDPTSSDYRVAAYVYTDNWNAAGIWATSANNRIARVETGGIGGNVGTNSGVNGKAALSIDTNDIATCLNGGTVATDTSHALTDFGSATLYVGTFGTNANPLNGHVKRIALFNEALSDQNLQSLTS